MRRKRFKRGKMLGKNLFDIFQWIAKQRTIVNCVFIAETVVVKHIVIAAFVKIIIEMVIFRFTNVLTMATRQRMLQTCGS